MKNVLRSNKKCKLDAIEEASVELMPSSSPLVTYNFTFGNNDNTEEDSCDEKRTTINEMSTIVEVNGLPSDERGESSPTNDGSETTTSNTSEAAADPSETTFHQSRSVSLPFKSSNRVIYN